jgi:hypothetical protein
MTPTKIERRTLIAGTIVGLAIIVVGLTVAIAAAQERASIISTVVTPVATSTVTVPSNPSTAALATTGTASATGTVSGKGAYALDFTLPTYGKAGCLVCHGDKNLVVAQGDLTVSYWIDEDAYAHSAHSTITCTGCHTDYGYKAPHTQAGGLDWRAVAKQSCKNCHPQEFADWNSGAHAIRPVGIGEPDPKAASKPLCGDCHGSHFMPVLKNNPAGQAEIRKQAQTMCGRPTCHPDYWANYNDYYHGAAYKAGASDAPTCWTCHGTHAVLKSTDRTAPTNTANLGSTSSCGAPGCHQGAGPAIATYVPMIHGRDKITEMNPIIQFFSAIFPRK